MTEPARFNALRTERLVMRRWLESDRVPFAALNADPQTMRFFPQTIDRAASDALVDRIETWFDQLGYGLWALEVARTGQFIGFTGINPLPDDVPGAGGTEIGWRLARHAWHHGYATEAARAALTIPLVMRPPEIATSADGGCRQANKPVSQRRLEHQLVRRRMRGRMRPGHTV